MASSLAGRATALRISVAIAAVFSFLVIAPSADAAITSVFSNTAAPIPCAVQGSGVRLCDQTIAGNPGGTARSTIATFDGVPIDLRVAFPPEPASGPDGPYPLIMLFHGYAGSKLALSSMQPFLDRGYAAMSITTRGFGQSCGTATSRSELGAACDNGYVRLMDTRYEVRDAQYLAGLLADDGKSSYTQIGAIGGSYGGGMSMALGALKDRQMLPDGSLAPWVSPIAGTPMQIAGAAPEIPWTDLAYSLTPNGSTLDYVADAPYQGRSGVLKSSWENALYGSGLAFNYAPAGFDPDADLRNWHAAFNAGEPYDDASGNPLPAFVDIRDELTTHHSSYYIDHSQAPAPMLISNGWTDDLFPVDEAVRFYNRTRTEYPNGDISLFFASLGHQRGQNKAADIGVRTNLELAWLDYYVKGVGGVPFHGVTAITTTCPNASASGGPFTAPNWAALAPGEVRIDDAAPKTILPTAGSTAIAATFDPITGGGACATNSATDQADTGTYRSDPVPAAGYTLMGSPTVIADITSPGSNSQIAARLLDVNPGTNTQTLVARGLWRPAITSDPERQVFQLHPNGYKFVGGHVIKLELLPKDSNTAAANSYGRTSNGQQNVTVENLDLRIPTLEQPGSVSGVAAPAEKFLPEGYTLARDFQTMYPRPKGATPFRVSLVPAFAQCAAPDNTHGAPLAFPSCSAQQASPNLTIGTPDANGAGANSVGGVLYKAVAGGDVTVAAAISDVRNASDLSDYEGGLQVSSVMRITDRMNSVSPGGDGDPATVVDIPFPVDVPCSATASPGIGSSCSTSTSLNAIVPGAITAGKRSVWEFGQVQVFDGGPDGDTSTAGNSLFAVQGVFAP